VGRLCEDGRHFVGVSQQGRYSVRVIRLVQMREGHGYFSHDRRVVKDVVHFRNEVQSCQYEDWYSGVG
jgi:hypothetical protein